MKDALGNGKSLAYSLSPEGGKISEKISRVSQWERANSKRRTNGERVWRRRKGFSKHIRNVMITKV